MKEFVALKPNMCSYVTDDGHVDKKVIDTKKCVIKQEIKFEDYKTYVKNNRKVIRKYECITQFSKPPTRYR